MVKKFFLIITVFLLTLNISNAYAIRDDYKFDGNYIEDYANLFDDNIEREKNNYFNSLSSQYNVPVYIYTVNESHSYTSRELSDELLYQRVGIDKNGILLLIDMYNSEIYITASGDYAIKIMDDSRQEELIDVIAPMIRSKPNQLLDDYYSIVNRFFKEGVKTGLEIIHEKSIKLQDILIAFGASVLGFFGSKPIFSKSAKSTPTKRVFSLMSATNMENLLVKDVFYNSSSVRNLIRRNTGSSIGNNSSNPTSTTHKSARGGTFTGSGKKF